MGRGGWRHAYMETVGIGEISVPYNFRCKPPPALPFGVTNF